MGFIIITYKVSLCFLCLVNNVFLKLVICSILPFVFCFFFFVPYKFIKLSVRQSVCAFVNAAQELCCTF